MFTNISDITTLHLALTAALCGLIWTIQLVHYPAFSYISDENWRKFHAFHTRNITLIVFPLMVTELAIACYTLTTTPSRVLLLICLIPIIQWLLTAIIFIPLHKRLTSEKNSHHLRKLLRLNWIRTCLWTVEFFALVFTNE